MVRKQAATMGSKQEFADKELLAQWAEDEGVEVDSFATWEVPPATVDRLLSAALGNGYSVMLTLINRNTGVCITLMAGVLKVRRFARSAEEFVSHAHELADKAERYPRKLKDG